MRRFVVLACLLSLAALFAVYVWPTRYVYYQYNYELLRLDRITGEVHRIRAVVAPTAPTGAWTPPHPYVPPIIEPAMAVALIVVVIIGVAVVAWIDSYRKRNP